MFVVFFKLKYVYKAICFFVME